MESETTAGGQIDCKVILAACPCGKTPNKLHIAEGNTCKYAFVYGDCCGEWNIEFRTDYFKIDIFRNYLSNGKYHIKITYLNTNTW